MGWLIDDLLDRLVKGPWALSYEEILQCTGSGHVARAYNLRL